ncbi:MAG: AAA family ATPase [Clostridia bacterium]|nr:AAA family ATPase [Clostridia bacterium]
MRNSGIQIRVSDLLFALQKRWKVIVALTFVGLMFGLILSAMTYVQSSFQSYEVSGSFAITTKNASGLYINNSSGANNNDFHLAEDMMDAVRYVIRSDRVMNSVINDQRLLGITVDQLRGSLALSQYNATQIIEMRLTWRNAEEGVAIWNAVVDFASRLLPETLQLGSLAVINEAEAALVGVGGSSSSVWMFLAALGFFAGVGFAVIELLMHPTLNNVKDVENLFGLETIGVIPRDDAFFRKHASILVDADASSSEVAQNYAAAAYILRNRLGTKEKHHCFFVTSATTREGKSTVAANLAIQLSDMEHRTLLIDFDTHNPSLGALFLDKVDYSRSLNALYRGDATEEEAITTLTGYLDLLPTVLEHNVIPMDGTVVELIERLSERYEYVILDAAPVSMASETLSLNQVANNALYVVGYDTATVPEIQSSLEKLDKSGIRVVGCVVNGVQSGRSGSLGAQAKPRKRRKKEAPAEEAFPAHRGPAEHEELMSSLKKQQDGGASAPAAAAPAAPRNILEDLINDAPIEAPMTDQETVSALLKIGVDGDWDNSGAETPPEAEAPAPPREKAKAKENEKETEKEKPAKGKDKKRGGKG